MLDSLGSADREFLSAQAQSVPLVAGELLPQGPAAPAYFPTSGLLSILCGREPSSLEVGLAGREGMIAPALASGRAIAPSGATVHVTGSALCLPAGVMQEALTRSVALRNALQTYALRCLEQAGHAIFAASRCTIEQRLARWLLMAQNRLDRDEFMITHEGMANALGVRRPGVTVALHVLEGHHAIRAKRGLLTIRSRDGLKHCAGPAYRDVFYDRPAAAEPTFLGPPIPEMHHGLGSSSMSLNARASTTVPLSSHISKLR